MAKMYRTDEFKTPEGRLFWTQGLFVPRSYQGKPARYGCTLVFQKKVVAIFQQKLIECVKGQWPNGGENRLKEGLINNPLLDGAGKSAKNKQTGDILPGYGPDVFFIRTTPSDYAPVVRFRSENVPATEEEVYSGCHGFAVLAFFAYPAKDGGQDGVGTNLIYVQKTREGERMSGGPPDAGKYFEKIADTGEAAPAGASDKGAASLFG